jgi:hypothetical protein
MRRHSNLLETQLFCVSQTHCEWLDAQVRVGIDDNSIAQAAISEFLYQIQEEERQRWMRGCPRGIACTNSDD